MNRREAGLLAAGAAFILDQGSKMALLYGAGFAHAPPGYTVKVLPFFNIMMAWNPGISLSLFPATSVQGTIFLATFQMLAVAALSYWMWVAKKRTLTIGLGMVIGGALGNLVDRLVYGKVADFFHLHGFGYEFYIFNVADAAITFGVIGLLYDALVHPEPGASGQKE